MTYHYFRSIAYTRDAKWEEARAEVDLGLAVGRTPALLTQDAVLKLQTKNLAGARKSLEEALKLDPKNLVVIGLLGNVYRQMNEAPQFLVMLRQLASADPKNVQAQQALGLQLTANGDKAGARTAFEAAKNADPTFTPADEALAGLDLQENAPDRARKRLLESVKGRDTAAARNLLAGIDEKQQSWDQAAKNYRRALELAPADVTALNNLANVLSEHLGKPDEAMTYAEKAKALRPSDPFVEDTLGCIYIKKRNIPQALAHLQASAKSLDRASVHYHLAGAYWLAGDKNKSREQYDLGVKLDPKSPERASTDAQMR